jgi:hypothetical protein
VTFRLCAKNAVASVYWRWIVNCLLVRLQPIPVPAAELGQSLLSVQHEKQALRAAVEGMGGVKVQNA